MSCSTPASCGPRAALDLPPGSVVPPRPGRAVLDEPSGAESAAGRLPLGGLLALAAVATWIVVTELFPAAVLPQLGAALRVAPGQVGYLASGFAVAATCAAIPFAALTRGLPRRPLLLALVAGIAAANAATAASSSYGLTFGLRIGAGLLNGMVWSMLASYAARIAPPAQRGRAVAITLAGITVALTAGLPASAAVAGLIGWRATFVLLAVLGVVLAGWVRVTIPALGGEPAGDRARLLTVARRPGIRPVLVTTALLLAGHQAMYTYIAPVAARAGLRQPGLPLLASARPQWLASRWPAARRPSAAPGPGRCRGPGRRGPRPGRPGRPDPGGPARRVRPVGHRLRRRPGPAASRPDRRVRPSLRGGGLVLPDHGLQHRHRRRRLRRRCRP